MRVILFIVVLFFLITPYKSWGLNIEEITTNKGVKLWFVEDPTVPIISMNFSFTGGAFLDLDGKEGTANFVASLLDESVGNFNGKQFREEMNSLGMKLNFSVSKDRFSGTFQTITENKKKSFELLKLSINKPLFAEEDIEKIRSQMISNLKLIESDIQALSSNLFEESFYKAHKFSKNEDGSYDSIRSIDREDLKNYSKNNFTKSNLIIGVSGDIEKAELIKLVDSVFGDLSQGKKEDFTITKINNLNKGKLVIKRDTPQTSVVFGQIGLRRNDEKYFAARIANYVLGGGGFQSKLYKNIREKRGLVYSIYSYLVPYNGSGVIIGGFQTKNENVNQTIQLLKEQWKNLSNRGITQEELDDAKSYFIGSFSRSFSSTKSIASLLNVVQTFDLGIKYFERRSLIINSITLDYVNKVSSELFKQEELFFTIVGDPK